MQVQEVECRSCGVVYIVEDRLNVEAIEDWGQCLQCDKLDGQKHLSNGVGSAVLA